jgi:hypothetical protein
MPGTLLPAGLDWGSAKVAAAVWDAETGVRMVPTADARAFVTAAVRFDESTDRAARARGRSLIPVFPLTESDLLEPHALTFSELKTKLALCRDGDVQKFVAGPVFEYWRARLSDRAVALSVSVPFEYDWETCQALCVAATEAGFDRCSVVPEALAALLAHLPTWLRDAQRTDAMKGGVCVWVLDCGSLDLAITLVHLSVHRDVVNTAFLAARRVDGLGGEPPTDRAGALERVRAAGRDVRESGFRVAWPRWQGPRPDPSGRAWVVPCGGGGLLQDAVTTIAAALPNGCLVADGIPPVDVVACGSAVHAATQTGDLPYRILTKRRMLIGLKTDAATGSGFTPMTSLADEPGFSFERAFVLPADATGRVELSLGAAPPGGGGCAVLWTHVLPASEVARLRGAVVLVGGRLDSWAGGSVTVRDASSGAALGEGRFRLPS